MQNFFGTLKVKIFFFLPMAGVFFIHKVKLSYVTFITE